MIAEETTVIENARLEQLKRIEGLFGEIVEKLEDTARDFKAMKEPTQEATNKCRVCGEETDNGCSALQLKSANTRFYLCNDCAPCAHDENADCRICRSQFGLLVDKNQFLSSGFERSEAAATEGA
jgi:hypothetical protein